MAYIFLVPNKIISGTDALNTASDSLCGDGRKPLIITDPTMVKLGNLNNLTRVLTEKKISYTVYSGIDKEPDDQMICTGIDEYIAHGCDCLIALGGGSTIDSMKAIGMMINETKPISYFVGKQIECVMPHMTAIPTTAGTGSEVTKFTIINDTKTKVKMLLSGECLMPDLAVIDPKFTMTAPNSVTAATGIDALCHCTEAYTSRKAQPLSDTFALSAARRIFDNLLLCYREPNNEQARIQMSLAAAEAGIAFNNSSVTIVHGMSRPIGAFFHVAHGLSNAILLEGCMRFAAEGAVERFADMSRCLGFSSSDSDDEAANAFIEKEAKLLKDLEIPTMSALGIKQEIYESLIARMTQDALASGSPANTIRPVSANDIDTLYRNAYR
ncbi:MAG: iron-containing alcohol dehydrogenase [Erysipelotrichia bacterium]|nr:iron-containing alcohol dehydrogenase [Erysipelotrichia bacterium]